MTMTRGFAVHAPRQRFQPFTFERRALRDDDVAIRIEHCGICHTDVSLANDAWGTSRFPMVPGHEITGTITSVGAGVETFAPGHRVGVGCFVDSCAASQMRDDALEQYRPGLVLTYNGSEPGSGAPTHGGYSESIVVKADHVAAIPDALPLDAAAPLLCAGTTMFSPLRHWNVQSGTRVGIVGIGGLGHLGVKLAVAMGAHVTAFGRSPVKAAEARSLGAHRYVATQEPSALAPLAGSFDLILTTASADLDWSAYLALLDVDGTLVLLGVPEKPLEIGAFPLITGRRRIAGSYIGSMRDTRAMLSFCAEHGIVADIERVALRDVDVAFARLAAGDVRHRFVIDVAAHFAERSA
ncbi:Alcohol dehydrogenase [Minicystis rosea]|nr:Alcohol dehydrogenase [Minicystis rosea]